MTQADTEYLEFATARAAQLFRSASLLTAGDTHRAEDLVQETLGRMYVIWPRIHTIENPAGYAQTVLVRTFLSQQRKRSWRERPTDDLPESPAAPSGDPSLRLTLLAALRQLPSRDRAVLVLRYWEDRSVEETAGALRVSPNAVRVRCVRALGKLRAHLGGSMAEYVTL
jgi:RNA polymerase sigma-70 factor (sigma-E family)